MERSNEIEIALEEEIKQINPEKLKQEAQNLSRRYCEEERKSQNFISSRESALAYAIIRMPATYTAVQTVLKEWKDRTKLASSKIQTILDLGAGTGAATLALKEQFPEADITCVEREEEMIQLGKRLLSFLVDEKTQWVSQDLLEKSIEQKADLVMESYLCNEWKEEDRKKVIRQMFELANQFVIFVEPGTPESFKRLETIKLIGKEKGFSLIAPCTHDGPCKLEEHDWCHSICRVQRSKIHRRLKQGELPYEDEKFSYLIFSKTPYPRAERRILRKPIIEKNRVTIKVCTKEEITELIVTKKEKELYQIAKKKKCGDTI